MSYDCKRDSILCELEHNIDDFVCVTTCGGSFCGLLTGVSDDAIKIVCRGRITVIRFDQIEAVSFFSRCHC